MVFYGFVVFVIVYFVYDDFFVELEYLDFEYFEEVVEWFCNYFSVVLNGVSLYLICLGSWFGFFFVSYWNDLVKVVVVILLWNVFFWIFYVYKGKLLNVFCYEIENV